MMWRATHEAARTSHARGVRRSAFVEARRWYDARELARVALKLLTYDGMTIELADPPF